MTAEVAANTTTKRRRTTTEPGAAAAKASPKRKEDWRARLPDEERCSSGAPRGSSGAQEKGKGKLANAKGSVRMEEVSRKLSRILRHGAVKVGLTIRPDGFCVLDEVLNCRVMKALRVSRTEVEQATRWNDKQRFELSFLDGKQRIRAVQGHSLKAVEDDALLEILSLTTGALPEQCVHGTYQKHWQSIATEGLIAGGLGGRRERHHIHFAPYDYSNKRIISGMRAKCDIAIYIDLRQAMLAGITFFRAKNDVILTRGKGGVLPVTYFRSVRNRTTGEELLRRPRGVP